MCTWSKRILSLVAALLLFLTLLPLSVAAEEAWDGSLKHLTLRAGEAATFIYTPPEDGYYTLEKQYSVFSVSIEPVNGEDKDAYPIRHHTEGANASPHDECYRFKGGAPLKVTFSMWEGISDWPDGFTEPLALRSGLPVKEIDTCTPFPTNGKLTLTLRPEETAKYKFTPAESGRYVLYAAPSIIDVRLFCGPNDLSGPDNTLWATDGFITCTGYHAYLTAGETYSIYFSINEITGAQYPDGDTNTYYLEPVTTPDTVKLLAADDKSATAFHGYVGGEITLFAVTTPMYYGDFVEEYRISNTAVADRVDHNTSASSAQLTLKKAGTVTVSTTVEGVPVSATVTVKERPVLEVGKTTTLTFGGSTGVQCLFTPQKSGTYYFNMRGPGGTTVIKETGDGCYWQDSGSLSAYLTAGKTYTLEGAFCQKDYTITVSASGSDGYDSGNDGNGNGDGGEDPIAPTVPTVPTAPTAPEATQPTDTTPDRHKVTVHKENGKGKVRHEEVAHLLQPGTDTVTVAVEDPTITDVVLDAATVAAAAQSHTALQVILPHAQVVLDAAILQAVADGGDQPLELSVEQVPSTDLTAAQQKRLQNKEVAAVVRLELFSGAAIHELGGTAAITVPFTPDEGKKLKDYTLYYLTAEGTLEKMTTELSEGGLTFLTTHFSEYVLLYEPEEEKVPTVNWTVVVIAVLAALLILGGGLAAILLLTKPLQGKKK